MYQINDSEGNVYIPEWLTLSRISDRAHSLYIQLCTYADNDTRTAHVSVQQLAKKMQRSEKTVSRYIAELVEVGAITKDDAGGDVCFRFLSRAT
jgi:predicted transcriptional regulator